MVRGLWFKYLVARHMGMGSGVRLIRNRNEWECKDTVLHTICAVYVQLQQQGMRIHRREAGDNRKLWMSINL